MWLFHLYSCQVDWSRPLDLLRQYSRQVKYIIICAHNNHEALHDLCNQLDWYRSCGRCRGQLSDTKNLLWWTLKFLLTIYVQLTRHHRSLRQLLPFIPTLLLHRWTDQSLSPSWNCSFQSKQYLRGSSFDVYSFALFVKE